MCSGFMWQKKGTIEKGSMLKVRCNFFCDFILKSDKFGVLNTWKKKNQGYHFQNK